MLLSVLGKKVLPIAFYNDMCYYATLCSSSSGNLFVDTQEKERFASNSFQSEM